MRMMDALIADSLIAMLTLMMTAVAESVTIPTGMAQHSGRAKQEVMAERVPGLAGWHAVGDGGTVRCGTSGQARLMPLEVANQAGLDREHRIAVEVLAGRV